MCVPRRRTDEVDYSSSRLHYRKQQLVTTVVTAVSCTCSTHSNATLIIPALRSTRKFCLGRALPQPTDGILYELYHILYDIYHRERGTLRLDIGDDNVGL